MPPNALTLRELLTFSYWLCSLPHLFSLLHFNLNDRLISLLSQIDFIFNNSSPIEITSKPPCMRLSRLLSHLETMRLCNTTP